MRSERLFCEQLDYNLLFRWFLDINTVEASFDVRPRKERDIRKLAIKMALANLSRGYTKIRDALLKSPGFKSTLAGNG